MKKIDSFTAAIFALLLLCLFLAAGSAHAQSATDNDVDLSDLGTVDETTAEQATEYPIGTNGQTGLTAYVAVDLRGLGPTALQHAQDAMNCVFDNNPPTQLDRLACKVGKWAAGPGWVQARDGSQRYVAYIVVMPYVYARLKWYDAQFATIHVVAGNWAKVSQLAACNLFYGAAACAAPEPPYEFAGVAP